jgi:Uma2 family endonuclease
MSATQPPSREATYDDLRALPPNVVGELIGGRLIVSPRPATPHALAASTLGAILVNAFQRGQGGPGGWWILDEPELHFKNPRDLKGRPDVLVPDLAGWRRERMPRVPDAAAIELAPDWVCEILSAGTEKIDRKEKLPVYARQGVACAWLLDPEIRTLELFRQDAKLWQLAAVFSDDDKVRTEPFEALEIDPRELRGEPAASP